MKHILIVAIILTLVMPVFGQEAVAPNGKFVTVNGAKIYYEEQGAGEPLLVLHGFGQTASIMNDLVAGYAKHYRVIAWDMRGHGRSTNPDTSIAFLHATAAKDLLALMDALQLKKVKALGHSSGGITILYAASMKPERFEAIVPVSAQVFYSADVRDFVSRHAKPEAYYQFMGMEAKHGRTKGMFLAKQFYNFARLRGDPAITPDQLALITARTLVIHGDNDFIPVSQAWEMYTNIANARLWISPNAWHEPFTGANLPDFLRRTLEFLKGDWDKANLPK